MLRLTQYIEELRNPTPLGPKRSPPGPVVIWNLIRRCNLACVHCYTNSMDVDFGGELSTSEVFRVMDDLKSFRVPVLILSGGEPLLRPDIFDIARRSKAMGFYTGLSTNGTHITEDNIQKIAEIGFDYVGISLDGIGAVHDHFRRKEGAYEEALRGIRLCRAHGIKVGIRCTLTRENHQCLDELIGLMDKEDINKFYLSHLNYSGRGNRNRGKDAHFEMTRDVMDKLFTAAWRSVEMGLGREFVTGNNDADAVYLLQWARARFGEEKTEHLRKKLVQWGGNSTGVNIANIDNLGNVHPDSFWWDYTLGNVRERAFSEIWNDTSDTLMAGLKSKNRPLKGRCGKCGYLDVCNGNTRVRAWQTTKDFWAEDPGCYLADAEIQLQAEAVVSPSAETARPTETTTSAIAEGIRAVGTGRVGSKNCTAELAAAILRDLKNERVSPIQQAAFFGALKMKGLSPAETILAEAFPAGVYADDEQLSRSLCPDAPTEMQKFCALLMKGSNLNFDQALEVGRFMFSSDYRGDSARALIASILRVRYSTPDEYAGLHQAMSEALSPSWTAETRRPSRPLLQLAEPFDGVDRSYLLTPIISHELTLAGFDVVTQTGRSSGPKFGVTLLDIARELNLPFAQGREQAISLLTRETGADRLLNAGIYIDQKDLSPVLDHWVDIRHQTLKRPFLATLEKYVNPLGLDVFLASAFHHNFTEKMVDIAERIGFPKICVVFKAIEGSLGLSLGRGTDIVISERASDGSYRRQEITVQPEDFGFARQPDPKDIKPTVADNARLIRNFMTVGTSGDDYFDARARYTAAVFKKVLGGRN